MAEPLHGLKVKFSTKEYEVLYNVDDVIAKAPEGLLKVTNLDYETKLNNEKRQILVLKPEYLGAFVDDVKNMMIYNNSSQFVDKKTKKVYNSRLQ